MQTQLTLLLSSSFIFGILSWVRDVYCIKNYIKWRLNEAFATHGYADGLELPGADGKPSLTEYIAGQEFNLLVHKWQKPLHRSPY